ncbi:MAG: flagellar export chaperone FlgN [Fretibacterium sp.]|nr:flagellar export chaperone FlgN [Fretibacterium sp.]
MPVDLLNSTKELLSRELGLCKMLRAMISRELETIVLDGDMDELLRILRSKDDVIAQLQLLADSWQDLLFDMGIVRPQGTEGLGRDIRAMFPDDEELPLLLEKTRTLAEGIMKAEEEAQAELEKHAAGLRRQITSRIHGRRVANSYAKMGGSSF